MPPANLFALATIYGLHRMRALLLLRLVKQKSQSQQVAWRLFLTVHALAYRRIDSGLLKQSCISFDDYDVMLTVHESLGQTLRMSELAEAVLLSNSGMSRRVARLVEKKLLHREQCPQDGRVFRVRLTNEGVSALHQAWGTYRGLIEDVFANHLSDAEGKMFGSVFQRILDQIGSIKHRGLLAASVTDAPKLHS
jgi:DNA-binding MarR family transcriptional regulator